MHPNPLYRKTRDAEAHEIALKRGFGVLTVAGPDGILAAHIPFIKNAAGIEAHLVRSNPIARALRDGPLEALLVVSGPDCYISPDWYGDVPDQVPTWNYVAIHLRGTLSLADPAGLRDHLRRLSARFETDLAPKPAWTLDKMSEDGLQKLERSILPVAMTLHTIDSTVKLNQNKTPAMRAGVVSALATAPEGSGPAEIAALMQRIPDKPG